MIYSKISTSDSGGKEFKDLIKRLDQYKSAYVSVGVHEDAGHYESGVSVAEVALFNEFGTRSIPERSFLRSAVDENVARINGWREEAIMNILNKGWTVEKALDMIGTRVKFLIQNKIKSNVPPPNAESTLAQKKKEGVASNTLMWSQLMLRSVTYKVVIK